MELNNIGNIAASFIQLAGFVIGGLVIVWRMSRRLTLMELATTLQSTAVFELKNEVKELKNILVIMARYEERMIAMDRRMDDLQHGRGLIVANGNS